MTKFKAGDIIAFSGKSLFSKLIKLKTHSDISHVGIIIIENGEPIICESTTLADLPDHYTGKIIKGVQKHLLSDRVNSYNGKVYHVPLQVPLKNKEAMLEWLDTIHSKEVKYDLKQALYSGLYIKDFFGSKENLDKLFCSELCCKALQIDGCMPSSINPSAINPEEFQSRDEFRILLNG